MELATLNLNLPNTQRDFQYRKGTADEFLIIQLLQNGAYNFGRLRRGSDLLNLYNRLADSGKAPLIIDTAANIGASTVYFAYAFPKARVVAIESEQSNFDLLRANTVGLPIKCLQARLAELANNLLHLVPSVTIGDILAPHSEDALPFILKIDIDVSNDLFGADVEWVSRMPVILADLHDSLIPGNSSVRAFVDFISKCNRDFVYLHDVIFSVSREIVA